MTGEAWVMEPGASLCRTQQAVRSLHPVMDTMIPESLIPVSIDPCQGHR